MTARHKTFEKLWQSSVVALWMIVSSVTVALDRIVVGNNSPVILCLLCQVCKTPVMDENVLA